MAVISNEQFLSIKLTSTKNRLILLIRTDFYLLPSSRVIDISVSKLDLRFFW